MIIIISGTTHTGKTNLAQKLLEKYKYPYLSIDHLTMGLIRSGNTLLTPYSSDEELTSYLWPIVKEMIKTAIENNQNLIVEGCYVPFDFKKDFDNYYLKEIKEYFLIMSTKYILNNYDNIVKFANVIENRIYDEINQTELISSNQKNLDKCIEYNLNYILIDDEYNIKL
jgi:adenylate kinase family enzyme